VKRGHRRERTGDRRSQIYFGLQTVAPRTTLSPDDAARKWHPALGRAGGSFRITGTPKAAMHAGRTGNSRNAGQRNPGQGTPANIRPRTPSPEIQATRHGCPGKGDSYACEDPLSQKSRSRGGSRRRQGSPDRPTHAVTGLENRIRPHADRAIWNQPMKDPRTRLGKTGKNCSGPSANRATPRRAATG
jgi:hypothetical protein